MLNYNNKCQVITKKYKTNQQLPAPLTLKNKLKMKKNEIKVTGDS